MNGIDISRFQQCCERMGGEFSDRGDQVKCDFREYGDLIAQMTHYKETNNLIIEDNDTQINMFVIPKR